ncbi:signal peptidase I [Microbacterium gorillae]|uniref:signal peptidase I n=1 Tax=Microbacterium gorillae TaxID=1231063 RepID=UPI0006941907|nr:signal peptidase I [Microbacterium gorillae]
MSDTLEVNDRVLVNELVPKTVDLERGDIVVFRDPGSWLGVAPATPPTPAEWFLDLVGLGASDSDEYLIKRVIGLPGDHVVCCSAGHLTINGVEIDEPYLREAGPASEVAFDVTVPAGHLWVMGDNRNESADSRAHMGTPGGGFVPISDVVGRAFVITWPVERWSLLSDHPDVFADVPKPK